MLLEHKRNPDLLLVNNHSNKGDYFQKIGLRFNARWKGFGCIK